MARIWTIREKGHGKANFVPTEAICVRVCSFTFHFRDIEHIRKYLAFYKQKTRPSSRLPLAEIHAPGRHGRSCHVCGERWFERLPIYLLEEPKRQKVVKALEQAIQEVEGGKISN